MEKYFDVIYNDYVDSISESTIIECFYFIHRDILRVQNI